MVKLLEDGASDGAILAFKGADYALCRRDPRGENLGVIAEPTSNGAECSILTGLLGLNLGCRIVTFC